MKHLCAILTLLLAGCASVPAGIEMTEDEAKACKEKTCTVWTRDELKALVQMIYGKGYEAGKRSL